MYCSGEKATLRTQSGQTIPAYPAQAIAIRRVYLGETAVSDGTPIGIYQYGYLPNGRLYTLNDGTWLLFVETPAGPQDVFVEGTENLNDLPAKAQERISPFTKNSGPRTAWICPPRCKTPTTRTAPLSTPPAFPSTVCRKPPGPQLPASVCCTA